MNDDMKKIARLREEIDRLDVELVKLLNRRARLADEIGTIKRKLNLPVYVPGREAQVIANVQKHNPGPLSAAAIARLYERIIDESRRLEQENYLNRMQERDV